MRIRFLLGPAGSGKTHQCVEEARAHLESSPEGAPLLFIVPKQATYQIERLVLAPPGRGAFSRLRIVSFDRLASLIFEMSGAPKPAMLEEDGRMMVLRSLLDQRFQQLAVFAKSARRAGFVRELSRQLRELELHRFDPGRLELLAADEHLPPGLAAKLGDLASLWNEYHKWLEARQLRDSSELPRAAGDLLVQPPTGGAVFFAHVWLDGFAVLTPAERSLLVSLLPNCGEATLAFCMEANDREPTDSFSQWSVVQRTYSACRTAIQAAIPTARPSVELLSRSNPRGRFSGNLLLAALEANWSSGTPSGPLESDRLGPVVRLLACPTPDAEAEFCAREIVRHVRGGGRYRDVGVVVRSLPEYAVAIRRAFGRYGIPCFLDQRERVSHHPLAELTRGLLGALASGFRQSELMRAFKTGFFGVDASLLDKLENLALEFGLEGRVWLDGFAKTRMDPGDLDWADPLRERLMAPILRLRAALGPQSSGTVFAASLRACWEDLRVRAALEDWSARDRSPVHGTVLEQMLLWLRNLERAFDLHSLPLAEWLGVVETGLASLTIGVIPPGLDQVLVGAIDRSRNPDLDVVFVLGVNEGLFPRCQPENSLLTEQDRIGLAERGLPLALAKEDQVSLENFLGYIAFTRARRRLIVTHAAADSAGKKLNPSRFVGHLKRILPGLVEERGSYFTPANGRLGEVEHPSEVLPDLLKWRASGAEIPATLSSLAGFPAPLLRGGYLPSGRESLPTELLQKLFGGVLETSVSGMEAFASCPFRFFVRHTLAARERLVFEFERKEQGIFQHEVLSRFHNGLRAEGKLWRDIDPEEARLRIDRCGWEVAAEQGHDPASMPESTRHLVAARIGTLQDFAAWAVQKNRTTYHFDPALAELALGLDDQVPGWALQLRGGGDLVLRGRVDRVDLCRLPDGGAAFVVVDYKSSPQRMDRRKIENGLQLQLVAYAAALAEIQAVAHILRVADGPLTPVGMFFVTLRTASSTAASRSEALAQGGDASFPHVGLFDLSHLHLLDSSPPGLSSGQFPRRITKAGLPFKGSFNALPHDEFQPWMDRVREILGQFGRRVLDGDIAISPYRDKKTIPCSQCEFGGVCRTDPWEQSYRALVDSETA